MNANGGRSQIISRFAPGAVSWLDWSPDGKRLVLGRDKPSEPSPVWVLRISDGSRSKILDKGVAPTWSPGGRAIASVSGLDIVIVSASGDEITRFPAFPEGAPSSVRSISTLAWQDPCTVTGTDKDDRLEGTIERDVICAGEGDDRIVAFAGNDVVFADGGMDLIDAGPGNDLVNAGFDNDRSFGEEGNDVIVDIAGSDVAYGGPGRDALFAWDLSDEDRLIGGAKTDRCWDDWFFQMRCELRGFVRSSRPSP
jgi:dipeptidyl aminopeptidase/acylaminoacyl peptidase